LVPAGPAGTLHAQERFEDRIEVTEVSVPVRVLVKGSPVRGLTRDDFELYEGRERREILGFEVRDLTPSRLSPKELGDAGEEVPQAGRRILVLADFSFSRRQRLSNALKELRESLTIQLHPNDKVAVATWGYVSGLNLLVGFTGDHEKIGAALDAIEAMLDAKRGRQREALARLHEARFGAGDGLEESSTYKVLAEEIGPSSALAVLAGPVVYDEEDSGITVEQKQSYLGPIQVRVEVDVLDPVDTAQDMDISQADVSAIRHFGLAVAELGYLLRDAGNRKEILMISEGFTGNLLTSSTSTLYLEKAHRALRESGWTLHGIDVGGLAGLGEGTFESNSLLVMSDATGGDLIENTNNFAEATERILRRTEIVYILTFQPSPALEGEPSEYRKIRVKLANPIKGARIEHRPGHSTDRSMKNREAFERRADTTDWLLGGLEASDLEVGVFAETVIDPRGGGMRTDVAVEIDGASLLAARTKKPSPLEARVVVLDSDNSPRDMLIGDYKIKWDRDDERLGAGGVRFIGSTGLPPGDYRLRVMVRNHRGGEVFLGTHAMRVGQTAPGDEPLEAALAPLPTDRPETAWITVESEGRASYFR
jgi:VWFA-related protein